MLRHFLAYVIRHVVLYKALQQRPEQEMAENLHKFDLDGRRRRNKTSTLQLDHFKTKIIFLKNFTVLRIRKDLYRIQLSIFRVPDPDPAPESDPTHII